MGQCAGMCMANADVNIVMGQCAGRRLSSGNYNVLIGCGAGGGNSSSNMTGFSNQMVGRRAGWCNQAGCHNVMMGTYAGEKNTSGNFNVFLGQTAGCGHASGSSNVMIGEAAGCGGGNGNCNVYIGQKAGCDRSGDCNVDIGPLGGFGTSSADNQVFINNGLVAACFAGSASAWGFSSDCRDKTNVSDISFGRCFLGQLRPRTYQWHHRGHENPSNWDSGFLAQELEEVESNNPGSEKLRMVGGHGTENMFISKEALVPVLVKAIQELNEENDNLKAELQAIKEHLGL